MRRKLLRFLQFVVKYLLTFHHISINFDQERLDKERIERRKAEEEEKKKQKQAQEMRVEKQKKLDSQIELKKKQFYKKMNGSESQVSGPPASQTRIRSSKIDILKEKTSKIIDHFPELRSGRSSLGKIIQN